MKFLEYLYIKAFINIIVSRNETTVFVETFTKSTHLQSYEEHFDAVNLNEEMIDYIDSFTKQTPLYYISFLDNSATQGAIPTCVKNEMALYEDLSACEYKCQDNKWTYYTEKTDLYTIEKTYHAIGLDFIFSPFTLLSHFFKDKISEHFAGYILIQEDLIILTIFENATLLYGESMSIEAFVADESLEESLIEDEEDLDIIDEIEDGIDLDDISAMDELDSLDDFGDIEDLDTLEEMDDFTQDEDVEEEFNQEVEAIAHEPERAVSNEDYERFILIQNSINRYYHDDKYDSKFLETIYIADGVGVSSILKQYFEEEMFINTYVRSIDIAQELSSLSQTEALQ